MTTIEANGTFTGCKVSAILVGYSEPVFKQASTAHGFHVRSPIEFAKMRAICRTFHLRPEDCFEVPELALPAQRKRHLARLDSQSEPLMILLLQPERKLRKGKYSGRTYRR